MATAWKRLGIGIALCAVVGACAGRSSERSAIADRPAFGGPGTEIVYSYEVTLLPPPDMPDWQTRKVASLPIVQFAEVESSGTISLENRAMLTGKGGPNYIELPTRKMTGYVTRGMKPGRYAFVKVVDVAQGGGQGLACVDHEGRPLDDAAIITLTPGATVYAGHIAMELALTPSIDSGVLEASFARLEAMPSSPGENFAEMRIRPGSVTRQPVALTSCEPRVFRELVGRARQCSSELRAQLDDRVTIVRNNRSMRQELSKVANLNLSIGPEQTLPCPN